MLWGVAVIIPVLRMYVITPWFNTIVPDRTLQELINVPLLTLPYVLLPLFAVLTHNKWTVKDLGLSGQILSPGVASIAILFGLANGIVVFMTNQAVIGIQVLPAGVLILLLYNNDFLEEFYHRGMIQAKLERAVGQRIAILFGASCLE